LGDTADKRFRLLRQCYRTVVGLSVTHCAQTAKDINTITFARDSHMSLPDRVKI